jgi:hypothetical protein
MYQQLEATSVAGAGAMVAVNLPAIHWRDHDRYSCSPLFFLVLLFDEWSFFFDIFFLKALAALEMFF